MARTTRPTVPALEEVLGQSFPLLDHGFVRVVDYMGDDQAVVQAARVSYGKGTKSVSQDKALIDYLLRHRHTTPFEMCELKLHIKLPIFVARQWIRHRTASVNEYSARYSVLGNEFYIPAPAQITGQSTTNKQGSSSESLSPELCAEVRNILQQDAESSYADYLYLLNQRADGSVADPTRTGLSRELARLSLTLNHYTEWYWKINLHNLLHFLALRTDEAAQYEIRVYAQKIAEIVQLWMPDTYAAFLQHRTGGLHLSQKGLVVVRQIVAGQPVDYQALGMSKREYEEVMRAITQ